MAKRTPNPEFIFSRQEIEFKFDKTKICKNAKIVITVQEQNIQTLKLIGNISVLQMKMLIAGKKDYKEDIIDV